MCAQKLMAQYWNPSRGFNPTNKAKQKILLKQLADTLI